MPIQSYRWLDAIGATMPRTLVIVEENASVTYIDEYASDGTEEDEPAPSNGWSSSTSARAQTCVTSPCRTGAAMCSISTPSAARRAGTPP